jgi:opacity protein-like surface antigen
MIKKIYLLAFIHFLGQQTFAADEPLKHYVSIGIGAPNLPKFYFNKFDYQNKFKASGTGPFHLKYENRVKTWLGIGLSINHMTYKISYTDNATDTVRGVIVPNNVEISSNNTAFNFRTNLHFINPEKYDKLDVYFGIGLGFKVGKLRVSSDYEGYTPSFKLPSINKFGFETTLGMRYFFDKNLGLYSEIGIAKSIVQIGLTARF